MKATTLAFAMAGALGGTPLSAQPDNPGNLRPHSESPPPPQRQRNFAKLWKPADKDGDGSLTFDEFSALPRVAPLPEENRKRLFQRLDKDSNNRIERAEMHCPDQDQESPPPPKQRLWELDADRDGRVSPQEFEAGEVAGKLPDEGRQKLFARLDSNGDGFISKEDRPKHRRREGGEPGAHPMRKGPPGPERFDTNGDKLIDFLEFSAIPRFENLDEDQREDAFEAADRNHNRKLSPDEWKAAMKSFHSKGQKGGGKRNGSPPDKP